MQQQQKQTISGKYWTTLSICLSIYSLYLQLADTFSYEIATPAPHLLLFTGKSPARQHVQHGKDSGKSQTMTELINQKAKGHFTPSLPPPALSHPPAWCLPTPRNPHGQKKTCPRDGNLHLQSSSDTHIRNFTSNFEANTQVYFPVILLKHQ